MASSSRLLLQILRSSTIFFIWFYILNFQRLCLSFLLLISSLLHGYSSLFLFIALHFVTYLMDGWLIMGTGMWLKFLWLYCYRFCKVILGVSFWGRQRDKFWESSCFTSFGFFEFVQNFFVSIGVMLSSLARSGLSSNTRLTVMILVRDWGKERERKTNYKRRKNCISHVGCMSMIVGWLVVCNWERMREGIERK